MEDVLKAVNKKEILKALEISLKKHGVHSFFSPSGAYRWMNCPGSEHKMMGDTSLENTDNEYSWKGTILHNLAEILLKSYKSGGKLNHREVLSLEGIKFIAPSSEYEATLAHDDLDNVLGYVEYCINVHESNPGTELIVEGHTSQLGLPTGSIDVMIVGFNYLNVIDLKSGFVEVGPEDNMQLTAYGLSAFRSHYIEVEEVHLTIYQGGEPKTTTITVKELLTWEKKFARAQVSRFFRPGEWCYKNYCPYMASCGQFADWVCDGMEQLVVDERNWVDLIPQAKAGAKFGEAVNTQLYKALVNNVEVEGYELGKRKKPMSWKDDEGLKGKLEKVLGEGEVTKPEALISPSQAKTKLKMLKKEGKIDMEANIDDLTVDNGYSFTIKESKEGVEKKSTNQLYFEEIANKLSKEKK